MSNDSAEITDLHDGVQTDMIFTLRNSAASAVMQPQTSRKYA